MLFLLGGLLLFFICKCMIALHKDRKNGDDNKNIYRDELKENHDDKNAINFNGISTYGSLPREYSLSTQVSLSRRPSKLRRRSLRKIRRKEYKLRAS